ncbi:hypothetical protein [Salinarimonas sp.]|uniref:hypothetical protein n=1 Tax=Salinarimonas sp. TaxID=2766526 RepID=UPI0032D8DF78
MAANDRDVYEHLLAREDLPIPVSMLAFAFYAEEKRDWIEHFRQRNGREPSQTEIEEWIVNLPENRFDKISAEAMSFFDLSARDYLRGEIEQMREHILHTEIVRQVRAVSGWWRQLAIALMTAILAPLLIGAVIVSALAYGTALPSLVDLSAGLREVAPFGGE